MPPKSKKKATGKKSMNTASQVSQVEEEQRPSVERRTTEEEPAEPKVLEPADTLDQYLTKVRKDHTDAGHEIPTEGEALSLWQAVVVEQWRTAEIRGAHGGKGPDGDDQGHKNSPAANPSPVAVGASHHPAALIDAAFEEDVAGAIHTASRICQGLLSDEELRAAEVQLVSAPPPHRRDIDAMRRKFDELDEEEALFDLYEFTLREFFLASGPASDSFKPMFQRLSNLAKPYEEEKSFAPAQGCHAETYALKELLSLSLLISAAQKSNALFSGQWDLLFTLTQTMCTWFLTEACGELCDEMGRIQAAKDAGAKDADLDKLLLFIRAAALSIPLSPIALAKNHEQQHRLRHADYAAPDVVRFGARARSPDTVGELLCTNLSVPPSQLSQRGPSPNPAPHDDFALDDDFFPGQRTKTAVGSKRPRSQPDLVNPSRRGPQLTTTTPSGHVVGLTSERTQQNQQQSTSAPRGATTIALRPSTAGSAASPLQRSNRGRVNPQLVTEYPCRSKYHTTYAKPDAHGSSTCQWCATCHLMEILFNGCTRDCAFKHGPTTEKKISTHLKLYRDVYLKALARLKEFKEGKRLDPIDIPI